MDKYIVKLTQEERTELLPLIRVGKKSANKLMHARVLLSADENECKLKPKTDEEIATEMHISSKAAARIRQRFVEEGMEPALSRRPHTNPKRRKIDGEQEAHFIEKKQIGLILSRNWLITITYLPVKLYW